MAKTNTKIGIIGGSGLDNPQLLHDFKTKEVDTPYGKPASVLIIGDLGDIPVVILSRHGKKHNVSPTNVPYRANIWALNEEGCTHILATTACGSLNEKIKPGDLVFVDQFIDFTKHRTQTFFDNDKVVHVSMSEPFDANLRTLLVKNAKELALIHHAGGTMITIEGPRFSTKAESKLFQIWGADVINMSTVPEVVLANELNTPYQSIAMVTDYDCWKENEIPVTFYLILEIMKKNSDKVTNLLMETIKGMK